MKPVTIHDQFGGRLISPEHVRTFHSDPDRVGTRIEMDDGTNIHAMESFEEMAKLLFSSVHDELKRMLSGLQSDLEEPIRRIGEENAKKGKGR